MAQTVPLDAAWSFQLQDSARISRLILGALFEQAGASPNLTWRSGVLSSVSAATVLYPVDLQVVANSTPNLGIALNSGSYVINRASQGPYIGEVQAPITSASGTPITFTTAPGTGQSRIDVIALQVLDTGVGDGSLAAQVIVVPGTAAATGSQTVPTLPVTGAVMALAQVLIGPNVTTIVNGNITDVRKSASVGRGPRFLLPGDALTDAGNCFGELRQRVLTTYTTGNTGAVGTLITEKWGYDSRWHGMDRFEIPQPTQVGSGSLSAAGVAVIGTFTIPDPGFPYHIRAGGGVGWQATGSPSVGDRGLYLFAQVDSSAVNTNIITQAFAGNYTASTGTQFGVETPGSGNSSKLVPAGYTGSHVVNLTATAISQTVIINTGLLYQFDIEIVPA